MKRKIWKIKEITPQAYELSKKRNISPVFAQVFLSRHKQEAELEAFLNPACALLHQPQLLPDLTKAVERINRAVENDECIFVVGDYDVDGVMSLAIFHDFIKYYPGRYSFYIPHRLEHGYGLSRQIIRKAKEEKASLIIAFDCGTNSLDEVELARSLGMDVIVVDHHYPKDNCNAPFAFVNPKRKDSLYPFPYLSGAALSYKLLEGLKKESCAHVLDLVALSVVCDVVPLVGENRVLLKHGLQAIKKTTRPAIRALCKMCGIKQENIDVFHLGYILGPRINASGRVAHAQESLDFFLTDSQDHADTVVTKLQEYNQLRKKIETDILKEVETQLTDGLDGNNVIVVHEEGWHQGVLGIVASRLTEKYYRPAFVISFDDKIGKGSARSIHSVHLMDILERCSDSLYSYGGHKKAAGIQILRKDLSSFKEKINAVMNGEFRVQDFIPVLDIDLILKFSDIDLKLVDELDQLKPYGEENERPLFVSYGISKKGDPQKIKSGYSVWLTDHNRTFEGAIFDKDFLDIFNYGGTFDIVYALDKNTYHNIPRLILKDLRLAGESD